MQHRISFLSALVVAAAFIPVRPAKAVAPDSVEVAPLRKDRMERDCSVKDVDGCRVLRSYDANDIRSHLAAKTPLWRDGDDLTFATEVKAASVELNGGIQYPMSRIAGTDLWVITVHVKSLDRAIVSYMFVPEGPGITRPSRFVPAVWRGPNAPVEPAASASIKGRITVDTLKSKYLAEPRAIVVYEPPARGSDPISGVVYLGDGGSVQSLAATVDTLIVTGQLPRILLVGIPSGKISPDQDLRAMEYLWGFEETNAHFLAHETFFLNEVLARAETRYGAPRDRAKRATWGISNSGAWAIEMGVRHPELIGNVLAFSPGGAHGEIRPDMRFDPKVRFFLQGGTLEPAFHTIAMAWNDSLKAKGVDSEFHEVIAGHDWEMWRERFADAVRWAFVSPSVPRQSRTIDAQ